MRRLGLLPLLSGIFAAQSAVFEGTAVNAADGQPLAGVHISLIALSLQGIRDAYGALSDAKGRFSIAALPAGTYIVMAERRGFIYLQPKKGALPIPTMAFKAGERITGFTFKMTPRAVISGRVVDDFGDPVENVDVRLEQVAEDAPVALSLSSENTRTDDHGAFRLSGAPGKFYVFAASPARPEDAASEIRTDGSSPIVYTATFYPNAIAPAQAAAVEARAGAEVSGIEIHLARRAATDGGNRQKARGVTLSGAVHGFPPGTVAMDHAALWFMQGETPETLRNQNRAGIQADGSFAIHTSPGFCRVWATYKSCATYLQSEPLEFRAGADVTGLDLVLQPAGDLTGVVEAPGDRPGVPRPIRTVRTDEVSTDTGRDGAFQMSGITPGRHKVRVEPLPENGYIESMLLDGAALKRAWLDVPRGVHAAKLKITLGVGAEISGNVSNKEGALLAGSLALVMLTSENGDAELGSENPARVDESGKYRFQGVPPGKYRIAAVDLLQNGFEGLEPKKAPAAGEEVEVKAGDRLKKDLTVTEASDAKK
jgi:hypothetical protein